MYEFGNVKVGGLFVADDGHRYRKIPSTKTGLRETNAVGVERDAPVTRIFDDEDQLKDIPYRLDRVHPISLEAITKEMEEVISYLKVEYGAPFDGWESDIQVLKDIIVLAQEGKWAEAYSKVRRLDTYVREYIPREMYNEICYQMQDADS